MGDSVFFFFWVSILVPVPQTHSSKPWFCSLAITHSYCFFPVLSSPLAEPQASNSPSTLLTSTAATSPSSDWTPASFPYKKPPLCSRGWSPRSKRENCRRRRILTRLISLTNKPCWRRTRKSRGEQRQSRFWSIGKSEWTFLTCRIKSGFCILAPAKTDCLWKLGTHLWCDWLIGLFNAHLHKLPVDLLFPSPARRYRVSAFSFPAASLCTGILCNWTSFPGAFKREYLDEYILTRLPGWVLNGCDSCLVVCKDDYCVLAP